jgi:hypothetical protein
MGAGPEVTVGPAKGESNRRIMACLIRGRFVVNQSQESTDVTSQPAPRSNWWQKIKRYRFVVWGMLVIVLVWGVWMMIDMPGESFSGKPPDLTESERGLKGQLTSDVRALSEQIGPRHVLSEEKLYQAADFIHQRFTAMGYRPQRQTYEVDGVSCDNIIVEVAGQTRPEQIVVIGAHYDTMPGCPGANDNASGVAGILALAEYAAEANFDRTVRLVAFVNEEPPYFQTEQMGSYVYAKRCHQRKDNIVAMISLDGIGYYTSKPNSQEYPLRVLGWGYPSEGNYLGFVGNWSSRSLVYETIAHFRESATLPSQGAAVPAFTPAVGFSDHWSFWQFDYPALMVTDTLPFRDPHYHQPTDELGHIDFDAMVRAVRGLQTVLNGLANRG